MITSMVTTVEGAAMTSSGSKVRVTINGKTRKATVVSVTADTIALLMADTGRMLRVPPTTTMELGW